MRAAGVRHSGAMTRRLLAAVLVVTALTGCGEQSSGGSSESPAGDEPVTPEALAWVAAEQLGTPDSAEASRELRDLGEDTAAASVRFGSARRGHSLVVGVSPGSPSGYLDCSSGEGFFDDCHEVADGVTLAWQEEEP